MASLTQNVREDAQIARWNNNTTGWQNMMGWAYHVHVKALYEHTGLLP